MHYYLCIMSRLDQTRSLSGSVMPVFVIGLIAAALLLSGCGGRSVVNGQMVQEDAPSQSDVERLPRPPAAPDAPIHDSLDDRAYNYYVNGLLYEQLGDYSRAAQSYGLAYDKDSTSKELAYAYARSTYLLRDLKKSIAIMQESGSSDPDHLRLLARCYHEMGMTDSVTSTYLRLVDAAPDDVMAYSFLASLYRRSQDLDSTIWAYRNLCRLQPGNTKFLNELGSLLVAAGDFAEARATFRLSMDTELSTENIGAVFSLGELYQDAEMDDSAVVVYHRGLEIAPNNLVLHSQLAALWVRIDSLAAALPHAITIVELSPMDTDAIRRLGILYYAVDSLAIADSILTTLVDGGQNNPTNHFYLGRIAALQDDWYRARDQFIRLTELADTLSASWLDLGRAYQRLNQPDEEIDCYRRGLSHMRSEEEAINIYFALGAAYEQSQQYDSAEATFEEVLVHSPSHAPTLNYLGYMLAERGERLEYAEQLIARALEVAPDNPAFLDSYGWVLYMMKRYEDALPYLEKAARLDNDPVIFDHLGDAYKAIGKLGLAREWWARALEGQPDNEEIRQKLGP